MDAPRRIFTAVLRPNKRIGVFLSSLLLAGNLIIVSWALLLVGDPILKIATSLSLRFGAVERSLGSAAWIQYAEFAFCIALVVVAPVHVFLLLRGIFRRIYNSRWSAIKYSSPLLTIVLTLLIEALVIFTMISVLEIIDFLFFILAVSLLTPILLAFLVLLVGVLAHIELKGEQQASAGWFWGRFRAASLSFHVCRRINRRSRDRGQADHECPQPLERLLFRYGRKWGNYRRRARRRDCGIHVEVG